MNLLPCAFRRLSTSLALGITLLGSNPALAQFDVSPEIRERSKAQAEQLLAQEGRSLGAAEDLDVLRNDLQLLLTEYYDIEGLLRIGSDAVPSNNRRVSSETVRSAIIDMMAHVEGLSAAELTLLLDGRAQLAELIAATRGLHQHLEADRLIRARGATPSQFGANASNGSTRGGFPQAEYGCAGGRPSYDSMVGGIVALEIGRGFHAALSRGCDSVLFGFNTSLLCIIPDGLLFIGEATWDGLNLCSGDADGAENLANYERNGVLHGQLNFVVNLINGLSGVIAGISSGIAGIEDGVVDRVAQTVSAQTTTLTNEISTARLQISNDVFNAQAGLIGIVNGRVGDVADQVTDLDADVLGLGISVAQRFESIEDRGAKQRISLEAIEVVPSSSLLIVATEAGAGNVDVLFNVVEVYDATTQRFLSSTAHTITQVANGIYLIELPSDPTQKIFRIEVESDLFGRGVAEYFGVLHFHRDSVHSGGQ